MNRFLILFLALALNVPQAQAGIRIINGGGGYGEMKALTALARLRYLLMPCHLRPQACGLNVAEAQLLSDIFQKQLVRTERVNLQFFVASEAHDLYRWERPGQDLQISSNALYFTATQPKKFSEIARIVFVGWITSSGIDSPALETLAQKLFQQFLVRETELPLDESVARGFAIQSMISDHREAYLVLDNAQEAKDVTDIIAAATKCESPQIVDLLGFGFESPTLTGSVVWYCHGSKLSADFALNVQTLKVIIFKERDCEGQLL